MDREHTVRSAATARVADLDLLSDAVLIARVRDGDLEAFDPLYRRHAEYALRRAHYWTRTGAAAEDLRAEAFTRVLSAIRHGSGPTEAMPPYLGVAMQHIAGEWARGDRRMRLVARTSILESESPEHQGDPVLAALERSLAAVAFAALPERWQSVLWHTEVEGRTPSQLVAVLGIEAGAVAALACRAREGLRVAYLQAHITEIGEASCRPYALRLGAYARRRIGSRERAKLCVHLRDCVSCARLYAMVKYVNGHLGAVIRPVPVHATGNRGGALVEVFVHTAAAVVGDFDVIELLHTLATRCVEVLAVDAAGLMLNDQHGKLRTAAVSSQHTGLLGLLDLQSDAGPCIDVCRTGAAVINADLLEHRQRWPGFAEAAQAAGYVSVYALPLRLRTTVMGVLNLFCARSGGLSDADLRTGQALANLAAVGIVALREQHQAELLATRLQCTLDSRVTIEQAKGVLAERRNISPETAFALMCEYARNHNLHVSDLARDITQGSGSADELLCARPAQ